MGEPVSARHRAAELGVAKTRWYPGRVTATHANGACDVAYDDGDFEMAVPLQFLKTRAAVKRQEAPAAEGFAQAPAAPAAKRQHCAKPEPAPALRPQALAPVMPHDLVGKRIRVWWDGEDQWYAAIVRSFSHQRGLSLAYDDGTHDQLHVGDQPGRMEDEWPWEWE